MNIKNILVIHTQPSFNTMPGKEALDLSLIFGSYEQNVSVLFLHQGVFQTLAHQDPEPIAQKNYLRTIKALDIYDVENVFVCEASLSKYGLQHKERLPDITPIAADQLQQLKTDADHVFVV